ncbi:unnamed protein product [Nesidiocoris tenuis]|uniref:Uncharacterized protein n=1 Tax=Nesidiocoris tenuis TaxID=355587 RepID=A0A6H5GNX7_9HEMI|nr:unnamed protein product [Nesidiocoris tenuis]
MEVVCSTNVYARNNYYYRQTWSVKSCDLVGMHLQDYCINFIDCCSRGLGTRVDAKDMIVEHGGRYVRIAPLPIGIPYDRFRTLAVSAKRTIPEEKKVVLGVDRLDYTKGLPQRLKAFELLLAKHPEYIEKLEMLQIAVPSRTDVKEYQDLKEQMDQLVGCINGRFSTPTWSPIRYIYGTVSQQELAAFYRDAAVCFVTPLRDARCFTIIDAVLIEAIDFSDFRALTMPEDERTLRMNYLRKREQSQDVDFWMKSFLRAIGRLDGEEAPVVQAFGLRPLSLDDFDDYFAKCKSLFNQKLALLLDYDGTLAPLAPHPDLATIPSQTKELLQRLSNIPDVYVAIVSGRAVSNVKEMVCKDGAWVESKGVYLTFHYRNVPADAQAELVAKAKEIIEKHGFLASHAHAAIEAKPPINWNKGRASIYILRTAFGLDWSERVSIIYAGDDTTDEDAFQALKGMAFTFRITQNDMSIKTAADRRLTSTNCVFTLLQWVERYYSSRPISKPA